jgi:hypothetical protein
MVTEICITQKDVDSVASFVEAANELELEPFFGKDEQFSQASSVQHKTVFHLGDRFHFRSALISFRRLWMPREPSYWKAVCNILSSEGVPRDICLQAKMQAGLIENYNSKADGYVNNEMTGARVIDLWLNTVFAHGGISGPNKRSDFEAAADKYGQGRFEYAVRTRVRWTGEMLIHLSNEAAKQALEFFRTDLLLKPSFQIGAAFGTKRREVTRNGELIIRQASSEHFSEETFEQRFERILKRPGFDNLNFIVKQVDRTRLEVITALLSAGTLAEFLHKLGGGLQVVAGGDPPSISDRFCASCTVYGGGYRGTFGTAEISREATVRIEARAVDVLSNQFVRFKNDLLSA